MSGFHFFAIVLGGTTGGQGKKLDQMFLELGDVFSGGVPRSGLLVTKKAAALDSFALPIDTGILQRSGGEILHDADQALLATKPVEKRELAFGLGRFVGSDGGCAVGTKLGLLDVFFP